MRVTTRDDGGTTIRTCVAVCTRKVCTMGLCELLSAGEPRKERSPRRARNAAFSLLLVSVIPFPAVIECRSGATHGG